MMIMYFMPYSQQTPLTSLKSTSKSVYKMDMDFIFCEVGTKYPCIICIYRGLAMDEMVPGWPVTAECWLRLKASQ